MQYLNKILFWGFWIQFFKICYKMIRNMTKSYKRRIENKIFSNKIIKYKTKEKIKGYYVYKIHIKGYKKYKNYETR